MRQGLNAVVCRLLLLAPGLTIASCGLASGEQCDADGAGQGAHRDHDKRRASVQRRIAR